MNNAVEEPQEEIIGLVVIKELEDYPSLLLEDIRVPPKPTC